MTVLDDPLTVFQILAVFWTILLIYAVINRIRYKDTKYIEVLRTDGTTYTKRKKPIGNQIIMIKPHRGKKVAVWSFSFNRNSILYRKQGLRKKSQATIMINEYANEAIDFGDPKNLTPETMPRFDRIAFTKYAEAKALESESEGDKKPTSSLEVMILLVGIGTLVILLYMAYNLRLF
jgi:hypothetical protein